MFVNMEAVTVEGRLNRTAGVVAEQREVLEHVKENNDRLRYKLEEKESALKELIKAKEEADKRIKQLEAQLKPEPPSEPPSESSGEPPSEPPNDLNEDEWETGAWVILNQTVKVDPDKMTEALTQSGCDVATLRVGKPCIVPEGTCMKLLEQHEDHVLVEYYPDARYKKPVHHLYPLDQISLR